MNYKDAINESQIWSAAGYDPTTNQKVVAVAHYGDQLMWLTGWGGDWKKEWKPVPEDELHKLEGLDFYPTGPKPEDQITDEIVSALSEIGEEYEWLEEMQKSGRDGFLIEPMGETYD